MPSSPFCSLASTCLVLPAEATCWPSNHAVHGKGGAKKAFFTLCTGPCSCAFGFQCDKGLVLAAAPSKLFHVLHIHPSCAVWGLNPALGPGRASPDRTPGPGMDYGGGEACGSPCLCRSCGLAPYKHLCRMRAPCGTRWRATWEEGKACLEACHTA